MHKKNIFVIRLFFVISISIFIVGCSAGEKYSMQTCGELLTNNNYMEAFECFNNSAKKYPECSYLRYMNGYMYYIYKGDVNKAVEEYTASINYYDNLDADVKKLFLLENIYNDRVLLYDSLKQYDNAISDYKKSIELEIINPNALNNLGWSYFHKGDYDKSIEAFNKSIYLKKDDPRPYALKGFVFQKIGNLDSAIYYLYKSNELKGNFWDANTSLGDIFNIQGKYADAIKYWERAIEIIGDYYPDIVSSLKTKIEEAKNNNK